MNLQIWAIRDEAQAVGPLLAQGLAPRPAKWANVEEPVGRATDISGRIVRATTELPRYEGIPAVHGVRYTRPCFHPSVSLAEPRTLIGDVCPKAPRKAACRLASATVHSRGGFMSAFEPTGALAEIQHRLRAILSPADSAGSSRLLLILRGGSGRGKTRILNDFVAAWASGSGESEPAVDVPGIIDVVDVLSDTTKERLETAIGKCAGLPGLKIDNLADCSTAMRNALTERKTPTVICLDNLEQLGNPPLKLASVLRQDLVNSFHDHLLRPLLGLANIPVIVIAAVRATGEDAEPLYSFLNYQLYHNTLETIQIVQQDPPEAWALDDMLRHEPPEFEGLLRGLIGGSRTAVGAFDKCEIEDIAQGTEFAEGPIRRLLGTGLFAVQGVMYQMDPPLYARLRASN